MEIPLLIYISRVELVIDLLAMDHFRCLIAGQTVAPIFIQSTYEIPRRALPARDCEDSSRLIMLIRSHTSPDSSRKWEDENLLTAEVSTVVRSG
jgi:hypothetical protein